LSYQVLARKWRPQAFDDVVGQDHVTTPLRNAIRADRVPHALLFTGPRGVGKTTLARILARCLNCEKGPTETPCGACPSCLEIAAGRSTDVQEIDAASRTGVDDVRELIEAVRYAPSPGKHRIFVVDEVHMLSRAAFNALLKTLEEPPPRSLFVFATTEPERVPFTVVSRCQRYDLHRIGSGIIAERLLEIAAAEGVKISERSLRAVAREADGSLRDAQTLLDQVISFGGTEVDDDRVASMLDLVDRRLLLALAAACVDGDPARALAECARAFRGGVDARRLGSDLLALLRDLVVLEIAPEEEGLVEGDPEQLAELREIAGRTEPARLRRMFRALVREQEDLAWAPQPSAVLEMAVVRLATLPAGDDVAGLLARLDALERRLAGAGPEQAPRGPAAGGGGAGRRSEGARPRGGGRTGSASRGGARAESAEPGESVATGAPEPVPEAEAEAAPGGAPESAPEAAEPAPEAGNGSPGAPEPDAPLPVVLDRLRAFVRSRSPQIAAALEGARLVERRPDRLRLEGTHAFAERRLRDRARRLERECEAFFGAPVAIEVVERSPGPDDGGPAPADRAEEQRRLKQAALQHPGVNAALELLGGEIVEIRPLSGGPGEGGEVRR